MTAMAHILYRRAPVSVGVTLTGPIVGVQGRGAARPDSGMRRALRDLRISPRLSNLLGSLHSHKNARSMSGRSCGLNGDTTKSGT